jgi:hypothetical protein
MSQMIADWFGPIHSLLLLIRVYPRNPREKCLFDQRFSSAEEIFRGIGGEISL